MKKKLKIFLCDLTYDTSILVSDTIPINIGYIASYVDMLFKDSVEISLFKYPQNTIDEIKINPPDLIAFSNYSWNSNLSEYVASIAKRVNSNVITVQGGTNFPNEESLQLEFLKSRPSTDIYTLWEGERSFSNVVEKMLSVDNDFKEIFKNPIDGCVFIDPESIKSEKPNLRRGRILERIKDLDEIPSPYLNGFLDKFFDGRLTPFIETNRGCPFTCSFCHTGHNYYHKLNKFSEERVKEEIDYIGKKAEKLKINNLHLADVNFGMYPSDIQTCNFLVESNKNYGWPKNIIGTTGKNQKERVIEITKILGSMFYINMSMQSMDSTVLKNINRANIKLEHMIEVNDYLTDVGMMTRSELILPLPGETKETFINGLDNILNSKVTAVTIYTLMLLHGTEFKNPVYREKFGYKGKFRIVPLNFGEYDGKKVFDYEEVGVETKDLPFNDYIYLRVVALLVETLHNGRPFQEFFLYVKKFNVEPASFIKFLYDNIDKASDKIKDIINNFVNETKNELWNSEEDLLEYYRKEENYEKLKQGKVGGNLIYKYKALSLIEASSDWIDYIEDSLFDLALDKQKFIANTSEIKNEISDLSKFCKLKNSGLLDPKAKTNLLEDNFNYDILRWIDNFKISPEFSDYKAKEKTSIVFEFTHDQLSTREDMYKRYGTDINALSKIVIRIPNLESQFRKVRYKNDNYLRDIYKKSGDTFVKYAISN